MPSTPHSIRLMIVDDHRMVVEGLSSILGAEPEIEIVAIAGTVAEGFRLAGESLPDVVLMDFRLPDGDGAQATRKIRSALPDCAVLFLSADASDTAMLKAVEAGACGYVAKDTDVASLVEAIRRAAEGEFLLPAATMARLLQHQRQGWSEAEARRNFDGEISPREKEVLKLMATGRDNHAIATELGIGYGTVRSHVRHILEKLYAHSRLEAVATAREHGLLAG